MLVFLYFPSLFIEVLDVDEAIYSLFSRIWLEGGLPYIDCVEAKPLGIYSLYSLIYKLTGTYNIIAVHVATIFIVGITAYIIYLIATMLHTKRVGQWSALFYIVFSTTYIPKVIATTIEPVMLLPISLQFYCWLRFEREDKKQFAYLSGLFFSTACLFKYQAGINLFIMIIYLGIIGPTFKRNVGYKEHWRGFKTFIIGAIPLPIIMLVYLAHVGSLDAFYFWNISGNFNYIQAGSSTISLIRQIFTRVLPFIASTILLWVFVVNRMGTLGRTIFGLTRKSSRAAQEWLILLWFLLTIISVATGRRFYGHYFLLLIPPAAILAAPVVDRIWHETCAKWKHALIIFWIIVPAIGFSIPRYFISDVNRYFGEDNPKDYLPLAEYISSHTKPNDRVVAWGFAPLIYWYSGRLPATRFFLSDVLTGRIPGLRQKPFPDTSIFATPGSWKMFFDDLERHKPVYFVDTTPANLHDYLDYPIERYPHLLNYIKDNYREETRINDVIFYRRLNDE